MNTALRNRGGRGLVTAMTLTSAAVLACLAIADPASAASTCGTAKTGHAGNTYQSCATSLAGGKLDTTNLFKHDVGATIFQVGVQTNGGAVVWRVNGTVKASTGMATAIVDCTPGSTVRGALRTKYQSTWDPTAYSAPVTCA